QVGEAARDGRIVGVGMVDTAVQVVVMDPGAQRPAHVGSGAGKIDPVAPRAHLIHGEAVRGEPSGYRRHIFGAGAEAGGELVRGEPAVVVGGGGILQLSRVLL